MNGWIKLFTLVLAASMASCGGGAAADNPPADKPAAALQDTVGTLYGEVLDNDSGAGLAGATVTAGGKTTTTGPDGSYLFENLALGRWVVVATASGHAEQVAVAQLNGYQGREPLVLRALAVGSVHSFDASLPQTLIDTASAARATPSASRAGLALGRSLPRDAGCAEVHRRPQRHAQRLLPLLQGADPVQHQRLAAPAPVGPGRLRAGSLGTAARVRASESHARDRLLDRLRRGTRRHLCLPQRWRCAHDLCRRRDHPVHRALEPGRGGGHRLHGDPHRRRPAPRRAPWNTSSRCTTAASPPTSPRPASPSPPCSPSTCATR